MIEYIFLVIFVAVAIIEVFGEFKENTKIMKTQKSSISLNQF
jgi:Flp pilus assembly pilin Flp